MSKFRYLHPVKAPCCSLQRTTWANLNALGQRFIGSKTHPAPHLAARRPLRNRGYKPVDPAVPRRPGSESERSLPKLTPHQKQLANGSPEDELDFSECEGLGKGPMESIDPDPWVMGMPLDSRTGQPIGGMLQFVADTFLDLKGFEKIRRLHCHSSSLPWRYGSNYLSCEPACCCMSFA